VIQDHPEAHFLVAGHIDENVFRPIKGLVAELSLANRVHFLGFRPDTADFLRGLDVFVLSSRSEGFSIATVEAMAAGLPVIATRSGGPEEIVEHEHTGILVPTQNPVALADGIRAS
jgi:glycosyltransferase involved in cell wall biosynthesis